MGSVHPHTHTVVVFVLVLRFVAVDGSWGGVGGVVRGVGVTSLEDHLTPPSLFGPESSTSTDETDTPVGFSGPTV